MMDIKERLLEEYLECVSELEKKSYDKEDDAYKATERKADKIMERLVHLEECEYRLKTENTKAEALQQDGIWNRKHEKEMADITAKNKYEYDLKVEKLRQANALEMERTKRKEAASRIAVEWAKVIIPTVVPIVAYNIFQKRVMKFEETGRICSTAGRELHLPKFHK